MGNGTDYDFFQLIASDIKVENSVIINRHTGEYLHELKSSHDTNWLANYIYNKYYACDNVGLRCLISNDYSPFALTQYDPDIYHAITEGCQHQHFRDYSWTTISPKNSSDYLGCETVTISNGLVSLECSQSNFGISAGKLFVLMPAVQRYLIPGWICVTGQYGFYPKSEERVYRYYHTLQSGSEIKETISNITSTLNRATAQYRLKIINNLGRLNRRDALVLYTTKSISEKQLASISIGFSESLSTRIPPLTSKKKYGWGFAYEEVSEEGGNQSYGMFCCSVIANAISAAKCSSAKQVVISVVDAFRALGRNPKYPYILMGDDSE